MTETIVAGRYRLLEQLAASGMSAVWTAHDLELDRRVALKLLAPDADPERFAREAQAAAALSHPNVCRLYDYGETDGRPFIVLELLAGGSLEDRLPSGRALPDAEAGVIARELASALAYAHGEGVVHRDVKPTNVLFDEDGRAKLADFGIARISGASTLTDAGTVLGTAAYISPEQARGEPVGPPADVYAFGVILYRMLTGHLPLEADNPVELAAMHATQEPRPIASRRSDAPPELERLATRALAKSPEDRPPDGKAVLAELTDVDEQTRVLAPSVGRRIPPRSIGPKYIAAAAAVAAVALAGAAVAVLATPEQSNAPATGTRRETSAPTLSTPWSHADPASPWWRADERPPDDGAGQAAAAAASSAAAPSQPAEPARYGPPDRHPPYRTDCDRTDHPNDHGWDNNSPLNRNPSPAPRNCGRLRRPSRGWPTTNAARSPRQEPPDRRGSDGSSRACSPDLR